VPCDPLILSRPLSAMGSHNETSSNADLRRSQGSARLVGPGVAKEDLESCNADKFAALHIHGLAEALRRSEPGIDRLTRSHPDFPMFASLAGTGPIHVSRWIRALGTDQSRYEWVEDWLIFAGIAPIIERSGKTIVTHCRWCCPTCLRQSFHGFAGQSIQYSRWAKAFCRQPRMRGKDYQAAVRSLAFQWRRMIFPMWTSRTPYYERTSRAA
jgi:hypothetical protein